MSYIWINGRPHPGIIRYVVSEKDESITLFAFKSNLKLISFRNLFAVMILSLRTALVIYFSGHVRTERLNGR